jgi:Skp family chaperone for outer membrane proteins
MLLVRRALILLCLASPAAAQQSNPQDLKRIDVCRYMRNAAEDLWATTDTVNKSLEAELAKAKAEIAELKEKLNQGVDR